MAGGDQSAALFGGLDDDNHVAQARYDPVTCREPPRKRLLSQVILGDDSPPVLYPFKEATIALGVDHVDPTAEHPDSGSTGLHRSLVRRRIYTKREPARHTHPPLAQGTTQSPGGFDPGRRSLTR